MKVASCQQKCSRVPKQHIKYPSLIPPYPRVHTERQKKPTMRVHLPVMRQRQISLSGWWGVPTFLSESTPIPPSSLCPPGTNMARQFPSCQSLPITQKNSFWQLLYDGALPFLPPSPQPTRPKMYLNILYLSRFSVASILLNKRWGWGILSYFSKIITPNFSFKKVQLTITLCSWWNCRQCWSNRKHPYYSN